MTLLRGIQSAFKLIKANPFYGEHTKNKLIPKKYIEKYNVTNTRVVDLPGFWRMIYTIESNEIEVLTFVLDIVDHPGYDKLFKFRKRK